MAESKKDESKVPASASAPVPTTGIIADRDLYLTEGEREVVEKGDQRARFLLAARGSMIEPATIQRHGLSASGGAVKIASAKERAAKARETGIPVDLGTPNEGQLRDPGEPEVLVPRTGVMRPVAAPRTIHQPGDEVEVAPRVVAVSNVPPEDDKIRLEHYEATKDEGEARKAEAERSAARGSEAGAAKRSAAKRASKRGK